VQDADAGSRDYRPDGAPTRARRLRVPKMRVCDERLGVKRVEQPDGSAMEGARRCRLAQATAGRARQKKPRAGGPDAGLPSAHFPATSFGVSAADDTT
jgi:hypothetical protein